MVITLLENGVLGLVGVVFLLMAVSLLRASFEVELDESGLTTHENEGALGCLAFVGGIVILSLLVGGGVLVFPLF